MSDHEPTHDHNHSHGDDHNHSHGDDHDHEHSHGNTHDQGIKGMLRYLRFAREMWSSEINEAVVNRLNPRRGERVMDIGAGAGAGSMVAAKRGCDVIAVEPTPYMRNVLNLRRLASSAREQITIMDGTAEATGVETGSVDAAWAVNTMHHWSNIEAGIAELARVLGPGGRLLLVDEDFDDPTHPEYDKFKSTKEEHSHHFATVDPVEVRSQLTAAGFDVAFGGYDRLAQRPAIIIDASKA